jgi:hypothetical protein
LRHNPAAIGKALDYSKFDLAVFSTLPAHCTPVLRLDHDQLDGMRLEAVICLNSAAIASPEPGVIERLALLTALVAFRCAAGERRPLGFHATGRTPLHRG